jgi:hypothetical protein
MSIPTARNPSPSRNLVERPVPQRQPEDHKDSAADDRRYDGLLCGSRAAGRRRGSRRRLRIDEASLRVETEYVFVAIRSGLIIQEHTGIALQKITGEASEGRGSRDADRGSGRRAGDGPRKSSETGHKGTSGF